MLEALGEGDWTLAAFAAHIAANFDLAANGDVAASIAAHLAELTALGLVEAR